MSVLIFIIILSFLVIIHELGHFFVAKWRKVAVEEFGLGYPPKVASLFKWKGTVFSLNAIPFGGFVRLEGEDGDGQEEKKELSAQKNKEEPFYSKSVLSRLAIILAGPIVNFLFGALAFSIIFSFVGIPAFLDGQPRIESIMEESPAAKVGLPENVNIIGFSINDSYYPMDSIKSVQEFVSEHRSETVNISTSGVCDGLSCAEISQQFEIYLRSLEETPENQGSMGIAFAETYFKDYPWYERPFRGVVYGVKQAIFMGVMMIQALGDILASIMAGNGAGAEVAGPVGIVHQAQQSNLAGEGFLTILSFSGMLSINLAIMNLLPIPALDGGRAMFIILEKIIGKKRVNKIEGYANYGGYVLLLGLIILITVKDVWRIFTS